MIKISNRSSGKAGGRSRFLCILAVLILLVLCSPLPTYADGGAPNLAYVVGTKQGISTIDIGQKAVTGTISINGDPRIVLLSLDGRFLYVAQPSLGRVTMIAAKTGQTVCSAN